MDYRLTFIFTYPKEFKLFSWIIKKRIKKNYCHVAVMISAGAEINLTDVYQAAHGMVHTMELDYFLSKNNIIKTYHVMGNREGLIETIRFLKKNSGKTYSVLGATACTVELFRKLKIGLDGNKEFICSEYGMGALETFLGKDIRPEMPNDYIDPAVFEQILEQLKESK